MPSHRPCLLGWLQLRASALRNGKVRWLHLKFKGAPQHKDVAQLIECLPHQIHPPAEHKPGMMEDTVS